MRLRLCRQITAASLEHLEKTGSARLFANLTENVLAITHGVLLLPLLISNGTLVVCCLVYLGWLSWSLLAILGASLLFGAITFQLVVQVGYRQFQAARELQDLLFG